MSTVIAKNVQIGTSSTATNNFTWYQPASPDGTVRLGVGNTGATTLDAITATSAGAVGVGTASTLGNSLLNVAQGVVARNSGATLPFFQTYNSNAGADLKTWRIGGNSSGALAIETVNDAYSSATSRVLVDSSGNVGIGTSSPVAKLNVSVADGGSIVISNTNDTHTGALSFGDTSANASGRISYDHSTNAMRFDTNGSERARIDSSGNLLVGTASALSNTARVQINGGSGSTITSETTGTAATDHVNFRNGNGKVGTITTNGTATSYNTSSDYRLKEEVQPMVGALARVAALKPVTYKWKIDGSDGEGFIAHELGEVVPQCVNGEKDAVDAEGNPQYQGIDTSFLVATLTAAIQEQQALISDLTARIAALEAK